MAEERKIVNGIVVGGVRYDFPSGGGGDSFEWEENPPVVQLVEKSDLDRVEAKVDKLQQANATGLFVVGGVLYAGLPEDSGGN